MSDYKVLIVDYDPRSIQSLRRALEGAGYDVNVAQDGVSGLEVFLEYRPHLTLVEAMLPKRHGFELCQAMKQTPHGQHASVAILTAVYKGRRYRTQAMHQHGADAYLEKPIDDDKLLETVGDLVGRAAEQLPASAAAPAPQSEAPADAADAADDVIEIDADVDAIAGERETEIADRLDDLFGDGPTSRAADFAAGPDNVVAFDAARADAARRSRDVMAPDRTEATTGPQPPPMVASGNGHSPVSVPQPVPVPSPPRRRPIPRSAAVPVRTGRGPWFWIAISVVVATAVTALLLIGD